MAKRPIFAYYRSIVKERKKDVKERKEKEEFFGFQKFIAIKLGIAVGDTMQRNGV